jgi:gluconolactonase
VGSGAGFTEGPVIRQDGQVVCTSIDHGCLYALSPDGPELPEVLAVTGGGPNGATEGPGGVIYVAQNGGRRPARKWPYVTGGVQAVGPGGLVSWVTMDPVSPNDLCFGPDGMLYVSDPTRRAARDDGRLWRCDPGSGEAELLASVPYYPNGIGFGLEDDALFVASTGQSAIIRIPVTAAGLGQPEVFVRMDYGMPDGFAFDRSGNIIVAVVGQTGPGEIQTYDRSGHLIDTVRPSASAKLTNVALSGDGVLIVTDAAAGAVLAIDGWPERGLALHPFRDRPAPAAGTLTAPGRRQAEAS